MTETKPTNVPVVIEKEDKYIPPTPNTDFPLLEDICGTTELKTNLDDVVFNIQHAELYSMMCTSPDKSYLFTGYPGTGKSFSMSAIRNELIKSGLNVMDAPYDIGTYGTAYINMGAVNLQKYFDMLEKYADQGHCVLSIFDEADSLLSKRGNRMSSHKEDDKLLNCLMKNQQKIHDGKLPIYMIFATNFPEALDEASVRSGRIDKIVNFALPDKEGLTAGYRNKVAGKNKDFKSIYKAGLLIKHVKYQALAKASEGFNFADIDNVIEKSLKQRVKDIITAPKEQIVEMGYVDNKQLLYQVNKLQEDKQGTKYRKIGFNE